uniref:DUF1501 domain-containing protein n=1 Tax=Schlesneria paludicola TaxID=360056 RepID=A0A7C2JZ23_9PLAN
MTPAPSRLAHPRFSRRFALQAGGIGLLGLGMDQLARARDSASEAASGPARSCIYIFLSGGLAQHDSFDPKPGAPADVRGEFAPIATRTPGLQICEHLPRLAARSHLWSVCRSLTLPTNDHSAGHLMMLTGRSQLPVGFNPSLPRPSDWPSIAAVGGALTTPRNSLPPAAVLPEKLIHYSGRIIPGQFAGMMGPTREPWFIEASNYDPASYGAYPEYGFDHQERKHAQEKRTFRAPNLTLPEGLSATRFGRRIGLLDEVERQRRDLAEKGAARSFDRYRDGVVTLLTDPRVREAFDVQSADPRIQERYGRNSFGWSLLMARRLVEAGVNLVQVNLGNNETWDTHGNAFPHLKDNLFPPTDRALSALLDDLHESGLLETTLIVMAGEFGRTPKISHLPQYYKLPGRDHWGAVQSVFFAGGGTRGGTVVGASDKIGAYPSADPQTAEAMASTIYQCLGIPETAAWYDETNRPHHVFLADPIAGLF